MMRPIVIAHCVGWRSSIDELRQTLERLLRNAERVVNDWEQPVTDAEAVLRDWETRDDDRRVAMHLVLSLPNADPELEWLVGREVAQELFPEHPYICALRVRWVRANRPNVSVVVRARDYHGRKFSTSPRKLVHYRETLARIGRQHGVIAHVRDDTVFTPYAGDES